MDQSNETNIQSTTQTTVELNSQIDQLVQEYIPKIPIPGPPVGTNEIPPVDQIHDQSSGFETVSR